MRRRIGGALIALLISISAYAVDPSKHLTQYAHTSWRVQDGVFRGSPSALTQTADGYLWIGTLGGVYRFDGVTLALAGFSEGGQMRSPRVVSLLAARDGSLWIGTGADLEHWQGNQLVHYPESTGFIAGIAETAQGAIWFTRDRSGDRQGPICRVEGDHTRCFGKAAGIATITSGVAGLPQDAQGRFWFGDEKTIYQWDSAIGQLLCKLEIPHTKVDQTVAALQFDATGHLLIGSQQVHQRTGLLVYDGKEARPFASADTDIADLSVSAILLDRQGTLWIGTDNAGVYRVVQGRTEHYRSTDGLTGESVNTIYEDNEGNIWVATAGGLDRFRDLKVTTYSSREGLSADLVNAVVGRRDGSVWLSNLHSLDAIKDGVVTSIRAGNGLPGSEAGPIFEDHAGALWVGLDEALFVYDHGQFTEMMPGYRKQNFRIQMRVEARIGERERIARDLHDTLLQGLLSASMQLSIAGGQLPTDAKAKPLVTRVSELLKQMIEESRNTVRGLRVRSLVDLEQAILQVPSDLGLDAKVALEIVSTGAKRVLRRAIRDEVYWIVRESIANALRHAEASKIEAELEYSSNRFRCVVRDDGKGFDSALLGAARGNHWGLSGMAERAKRIEAPLNVLTAKGAGTEIELIIPSRVAYETLLWKSKT